MPIPGVEFRLGRITVFARYTNSAESHKFGGFTGVAYAEAGDAVAESLVVHRSSYKRATLLTIHGDYAPDTTMS